MKFINSIALIAALPLNDWKCVAHIRGGIITSRINRVKGKSEKEGESTRVLNGVIKTLRNDYGSVKNIQNTPPNFRKLNDEVVSSMPTGVPSSTGTSVALLNTTMPSTIPTSIITTSVEPTIVTNVVTLLPTNSTQNLSSESPSSNVTFLPRFPTTAPYLTNTSFPSAQPSLATTSLPSAQPSLIVMSLPSSQPSFTTTSLPSAQPSSIATLFPSAQPSLVASPNPTSTPTAPPLLPKCVATKTATMGTRLKPNEFICSSNSVYRFGMTINGALSLFQDEMTLWSASYHTFRPECTVENGCVTEYTPYFQVQESDGNVVVYNNKIEGLWRTDTVGNNNVIVIMEDDGSVRITAKKNRKAEPVEIWSLVVSHTPTLIPSVNVSPTSSPECIATCTGYEGTVMRPNQFICSNSLIYRFGMSVDGKLSLWKNDIMVWNAPYHTYVPECTMDNGCVNSKTPSVRIQGDGNMVVYNDISQGLWGSGTEGENRVAVTMHDDGVVRMVAKKSGYDPIQIWSLMACHPVV